MTPATMAAAVILFAVHDFLAFAKQTGNELVGHGEQDGEFWFVLKRR